MKKVLALIEHKKGEFAKLPLFEFMRDPSIDPKQRLAWAPCAAPFIMSFGELNRDVLREEPTTDKIQLAINKHTYEEYEHCQWFLEDLNKLGFDLSMNFNDSLKFLWSEETKTSRYLAYQLYRYIFQVEPIDKFLVLEVIEATSNVVFSVTTRVTDELKVLTKQEYRYFGDFHLAAENNHSIYSHNMKQSIANIQLTENSRYKAFKLIDEVFELFSEFTNDLLASAKVHPVEPTLQVV